MKRHILPLLGAALLASCEKTMDFKGETPDPKLILGTVVHPVADPEYDPQSIGVRESVFLYGGDKPRPVTDATFRVWRNGTEIPVEKETDEHSGGTYYSFLSQFAAGDRIELEGETPRHGRVTASDVVPATADLRGLKTEWFQENGEWYLRTLVTIADPAGERNYYRVNINSETDYLQTYWTGSRWETREDTYPEYHGIGYVDREILFKNFGGDPAGGDTEWGQISDELIDGREYTLDLYIKLDRRVPWRDDIYTDPDDPGYNYGSSYKTTGQRVTVELQTLSEGLFKYLRSTELMSNEHNFSEPVQLYSNVAGGYGILGAYNVASKTAELELE